MIIVSKILTAIGALLMLFGIITFFKGSSFLGVGYAVNYFHAATSFLVIALCAKFICKQKKTE
ncbi:MAG: hypothetical protein K9N07_00285 [Candidatus Cloacimonetes bacterium]|nr:hypothetical protein [Candidatus Cloacimonadota bacterium]